MANQFDVIVIGAGAAGLMCAATAGYRGRSVLVLDHAGKIGRKIAISGGGSCNFTNRQVGAENYLCANPHFVKSALARYPASHFIELVERHGIEYHERDHGQLFCDGSARQIVDMLRTECDWAGVTIALHTEIAAVKRLEDRRFEVHAGGKRYQSKSLVIATGGLSIPKMGATPLGYQIAEQFGLKVVPTRAGLVPFTWHAEQKQQLGVLSGISVPCRISAACGPQFSEALLFTHRGLSGPAILQVSNYWQPGEAIEIDFMPGQNALELLEQARLQRPKQNMRNTLSQWLPRRLVDALLEEAVLNKPLNQFSQGELETAALKLNCWQIRMNGTEGYRTAEVTLGGVNTDELSSQTMEARKVPGLFFVGEVMDVSGWLGGYNFQWAWASGVAAGQAC